MDFYTRISDYYNDIFPLNKAQIPFVRSCGTNFNNVLDIGCGTGGLATALCDTFESVYAIDPNAEMLNIAKNNNTQPNLVLEVGGMLDIDNLYKDNFFDTAICFGNTVVHLSSLEEISSFFRKVRRILKTDGCFLFQIINYDNVLNNKLGGLPTIQNEEIRFVRDYSLDNQGRIDFRTTLTIIKTGEEIISNVKLFPARKREIETALVEAGFKSIIAYSSFKKDKYNPNSLPLVFECS